ncbi:MAG: clostripain-related cysteine peptidase [Thermoplasmatota archaeon]|nr:hypothetical protein [Candidatus Thermoplasmatota archaeon]MBU1914610.1 hypothetical protein [Candidatus Thermoplasmatota archaeon]
MTHKFWSACIIAIVSALVATYAIPVVASAQTAEWTVLVYLDGDNNLDPDSVTDVAEMMTVGSTEKVNVIVLWDRYSEPAYLYKVLPRGLELLVGMTVNGAPVNGQEVNMGDWHVLEAFVDYGKANYPANHFMLDLWDHGSPFGYTCWDDHNGTDLAAPEAISLSEVGQALEGSGAMDILTYDGCTIGMAEIAYELTLIPPEMNVQIGYLVASEEYIPNNGYAYNNVLMQMNSMEDMSAGAVAKMLADQYAACYSPKGQAKGSSTVGLSVIDVSKIGPIASVLKSLTVELKAGLAEDFKYYKGLISDARGEANLGWSLNGWDKRVDLGTFLMTLSAISEDQDVKVLADQAFGIIKDAVYVANTPALESQSAFGLGVWFPTSYRSLGNANNGGFWTLDMYQNVFGFADDAGWMGFLYAYWGRA